MLESTITRIRFWTKKCEFQPPRGRFNHGWLQQSCFEFKNDENLWGWHCNGASGSEQPHGSQPSHPGCPIGRALQPDLGHLGQKSRSQEGPYCITIIVTSSKTVPLLCLCLEWGKEFILDQVWKQLFPTWQFSGLRRQSREPEWPQRRKWQSHQSWDWQNFFLIKLKVVAVCREKAGILFRIFFFGFIAVYRKRGGTIH